MAWSTWFKFSHWKIWISTSNMFSLIYSMFYPCYCLDIYIYHQGFN
jgi:hypothetical protein